MKKVVIFALLAVMAGTRVFAGDAAAFSDIGFSKDGKTYIFGEYGKIDKKFQAWAEIYAVDVEKNAFVPNCVYKIAPSAETVSVSGKLAYESLLKRASAKFKAYDYAPSGSAGLLYVKEEAVPTNEIYFKDFESSDEHSEIYYHIKLIPTYVGKGVNVSSKYYIVMNKEDEDGRVLKSWRVGNPDYVRKGVSSYQIERVFTDNAKRSLVFVIQKTQEDETGTSIRYMVETVRF